MTVGPGSSDKVLGMYMTTSLCEFVLGTQKITSSQNKIPAFELHLPSNCKAI
jgi:hypothetical protein